MPKLTSRDGRTFHRRQNQEHDYDTGGIAGERLQTERFWEANNGEYVSVIRIKDADPRGDKYEILDGDVKIDDFVANKEKAIEKAKRYIRREI